MNIPIDAKRHIFAVKVYNFVSISLTAKLGIDLSTIERVTLDDDDDDDYRSSRKHYSSKNLSRTRGKHNGYMAYDNISDDDNFPKILPKTNKPLDRDICHKIAETLIYYIIIKLNIDSGSILTMLSKYKDKTAQTLIRSPFLIFDQIMIILNDVMN